MLAGVGGIDLFLLVIAADESIKPQTREHFDICRLLAVRRGLTVLTKSDAVDAETLEVARLEVAEFLRGSFLDSAQAPIVAVSSLTGAGLPELKQELARVAAEVPAKDSSALARLPIDRVFTMKGFGTVVTGTLVAGTIRKEEQLEVFPSGKRVRVRGVQVHGEAAEQAVAGQRTALNLAGVSVEDLSRGMMLAPSDTFRSTRRMDATLSLLPSAKPLKDRARVHLHAYASETVAEVVLYREKQLDPGGTAYTQFRMAEPALLLPGDRFILRQFSPVVTIGGGVVLDAIPLTRRKKGTVEPFLTILEGGNSFSILRARLAQRHHEGLTLAQVTTETGWRGAIVESHLSEAIREGRVLRIGDRLVHAPAIEGLKLFLISSIDDFHKKNPLVPGISREELREMVRASAEVLSAALDGLVKERRVELSGELVRLPGRGIVMKDEETESKKIIEQAFASAGLQVPALYTVLAGLKVDKARAQKIVTLLLRDKVLVKFSDDLVFHQSALQQLRKQIAAYRVKSAKIDVGKFKEMTGVSRKYAIPLLEYLDRERVTKRVGDERVIL
jgi:selenocysteine-specific elongation factor